jgi:YbgC/YbaW family acyl-CoA thioester hydrolase
MAEVKSTVFEYRLLIREHHLDTFGHVNNAVYLALFEEARWQFVTELGFGIKQVQETQTGPTILEVKLQFKREIKNRETIVIRTQVTDVTGKITTLRQAMVNAAGEEACIAEFKVGLFDLQARKLILPTEAWSRALGLT